MKRLLAVVSAGLVAGCLTRPWNVEESDRIAAIVAQREDPADEAAVEGTPALQGASVASDRSAKLSPPQRAHRTRKSSHRRR